MYLERAFIRNSGPIESLDLELSFAPTGQPLPHILVGGNGSGKTNLLSIIADSLIEGAAAAFQDIVSGSGGGERPWFRVVGSKTITHNVAGGFSILRYRDADDHFFYKEKAGVFPVEEARRLLPSSLADAAAWEEKGNVKAINIGRDLADSIFRTGVYTYFPASRAEYPHWLNRQALFEERFDTDDRFSSRLGKPVFVERGVEKFTQWLASVIVDARVDLALIIRLIGRELAISGPDAKAAIDFASDGLSVFDLANQILRVITLDPASRFSWGTRRHSRKIAITTETKVLTPGLDGLSSGQASLLNIFGTILRYGDLSKCDGPLNPSDIQGICIVDEIDAHMHVDLQVESLPKLLAMFPGIQFIVSAHSPLFLMGIEKHFGSESVRILELPSGSHVTSEKYYEFSRALAAFKETKAFEDIVSSSLERLARPRVWLEGETDPIYLKTAAQLLGFSRLADNLDFEWIGAKSKKDGQGFNTGKDALNKALVLLMSKPQLSSCPIVLLYDSDANKADVDGNGFFVRSLPYNLDNQIARSGVENLLPDSVFTDDMYDTHESVRDYGERSIVTRLNKMRLCESVCARGDASDFGLFRPILEEIESITLGKQSSSGDIA